MSFSDTANAKKYASIAETAAAQAKLSADKLDNAPDYAAQAASSALASAASAQAAVSAESVVNNLSIAASESATEAAASAAVAGNSAAAAVGQCVRVPEGELIDVLPQLSERLNTFLTFDSSGNTLLFPESDVAILDSEGKIPVSMIPAIALSDIFVVNSQEAMLALDAQEGDIAKRTDLGYSFILATEPTSVLSNWVQLNDDVLAQLGTSTGATQVGAVDPIGNPTTVQAAIDAKLSSSILAASTGAEKVGYGSITVKDYLDGLGNKRGYSYLGELQSVADFYGMTLTTGKKVSLKGWYTGSAIGGGYFYFDSTVSKSSHDGGVYISPTVPYTTPDNFIIGVGETDTAGLGCWVRAGISSELRGEWYGMASGVDVTVMSNKMAATAGKLGLGLVWPVGNMNLSGAVTILCDNSSAGQVKYIRGTGKRGTVFTVDVAKVTTFAMTVIGSIGATNATHDMITIRGMKFRGNGTKAAGTNYSGTGLYLQNILGFHMEDINTENFNRGLITQNSLYGLAVSCRFQSSGECVVLRRNNLTTGVNAMHFIRCDFNDNSLYCVNAIESHAVMFTECTFEGNGGKTDSSGAVIAGVCCVQVSAVGGAGGVGFVFDTCYFEGNAILDIKHIVSTNYNQTLTIRNCIFNKTRSDMTAGRVQMIRSSGGNGMSTLEMTGNRFYSGTNNADATYPDVELTGFQALGYGKAEFLDLSNIFTANTKISRDTYVAWKKSNDDGFVCRGIAAGGFSATASRNILSCTRSAVGTYRVITNQLTTLFDYQVTLDNLGFSTIDTSENNEAFTIKTYNGSGVLADVGFRVRAKII